MKPMMTKSPGNTVMKLKCYYVAITLLIVSFCQKTFAQEVDVKHGKELWEQQCIACHAIDRIVVGPALGEVHNTRSEEWLIKWIRNNVKLRAEGDEDAIALYKEWNGAAMNIFENLSENDVRSILAFIKQESEAKKSVVVESEAGTTSTASGGAGGFYNKNTLYLLLAISLILLIIALILYRLKSSVRGLVNEKFPEEVEENQIAKKIKTKTSKINPTIATLGIISTIGGLLFVYGFYFGVTEVGVQRGYAPEQPIAFSHKIHAGDLNIDCRYCHSTVDYSKSASIPSLNTCMNCHTGVQLRDKYNGEVSPEIQKIYKALDYNPDEQPANRYGSNPTNIKWIRIHNLPDLSYFNHSQHTNVAGLECQQCHGPVQEMEVLQQHATLQMGWCVDCHRNTGVDVENNDYYEELHKYAKDDIEKNGNKSRFIKNGKVNVNIADIGGLECSKCHY
jgi:mono/diheme cytochrome c family protein